MAEEQYSGEKVGEEVRDRGMFDFLGKKKEAHEGHEGEGKCEVVTVTEVEKVEGEGKCQEEVLVTEFENKVQVTEKEEKKEGLLEKLRRSHSSSSSSSSDEEEAAEGEGEKKKKKKNLKDKIKEKISAREKKEEATEELHKEEKVEAAAAAVAVEDNTIPVEKIDELVDPPESDQAQEKKSLLAKIKEKLPGGKKPAEEAAAPVAEQCAEQGKEHHEGDSPKEKKGILGKIMDKIPGYHKGTGAEEGGAAH